MKSLNKQQIQQLIRETVKKKLANLNEDIDVDDIDVWNEYDQNRGDEEYKDIVSHYGKMPNGYDKDITDPDTLDKIAMLNNLDNMVTPTLKRAENNASWNALTKANNEHAKNIRDAHDDNYDDDMNSNIFETKLKNIVRKVLYENINMCNVSY